MLRPAVGVGIPGWPIPRTAPPSVPAVKKKRAGEQAESELLRYVALELAALGALHSELLDIAQPLLRKLYWQPSLSADRRIQELPQFLFERPLSQRSSTAPAEFFSSRAGSLTVEWNIRKNLGAFLLHWLH